MDRMTRYAVYYAPRPGAFADRAAAWLGRDAATGAAPVPPDLPGLPQRAAALTTAPARYGFHGTIRAPFRLAAGLRGADVADCVADLARHLPPPRCDGLHLANLDGFLALLPSGEVADIQALGAAVVKATNPLRAALTPAEIARRRPETLSPRGRALLDRWGYPHVMEAYRFHLTLTDRLPADEAPPVLAALQAHFAPVLPSPFVIEDLCLFGEDPRGLFHLLHRFALTG